MVLKLWKTDNISVFYGVGQNFSIHIWFTPVEKIKINLM